MRIATRNIGGGLVFSQERNKFDREDLSYFIEEIKKIQADFICLQEVHISETSNQVKSIANALGYEFFEVESIANSHLKDGEKLSIALISKYPITQRTFHTLPNPKLQSIINGQIAISHDKGFLECKIHYEKIEIRILSGHMVPFRKFEKNFLDDEFKGIRNRIGQILSQENLPTIMGADMNFEDINALIPKIFKEGFQCSPEESPTTPKGRKYDKIIISKDWKLITFKTVPGIADHYLCYADITL